MLSSFTVLRAKTFFSFDPRVIELKKLQKRNGNATNLHVASELENIYNNYLKDSETKENSYCSKKLKRVYAYYLNTAKRTKNTYEELKSIEIWLSGNPKEFEERFGFNPNR